MSFGICEVHDLKILIKETVPSVVTSRLEMHVFLVARYMDVHVLGVQTEKGKSSLPKVTITKSKTK